MYGRIESKKKGGGTRVTVSAPEAGEVPWVVRAARCLMKCGVSVHSRNERRLGPPCRAIPASIVFVAFSIVIIAQSAIDVNGFVVAGFGSFFFLGIVLNLILQSIRMNSREMTFDVLREPL